MINVGDVLSYLDMCREEGVNLRRGMNFRLRGRLSVILMSTRAVAPYADRIEENDRMPIYEGHDAPKLAEGLNPKTVDQPMYNPTGSLTQNGLFYEAANSYKQQKKEAELLKVYEKIRPGIWTYNGISKLVDSWQEKSNNRKVARAL